jgi:hypothetical protein
MPRTMQECHDLGQHRDSPRARCPQCAAELPSAMNAAHDRGEHATVPRFGCPQCPRGEAGRVRRAWALADDRRRAELLEGAHAEALRIAEVFSGFRTVTPAPASLAHVEILRANGTREAHEVGRHILLEWIRRMIGAACLDTVNLRDGRVMLVDDSGLIDGRPENPAATALYHSVCIPGTTNPIAGDVAIALDADFGED